jgi:murein hydrolase activator
MGWRYRIYSWIGIYCKTAAMIRIIVITGFIFISFIVSGQSRSELEAKRKKTLEEIAYVDNIIKETERQKSSGINDIRIIGNKLLLRENVIGGMREEIDLLTERIEINELALNLMEKDLEVLKKEYAQTIVNSYKSGKGYSELAYLFSAKDFNQGYKRIRYLQQVAEFRRNEAETISGLKQEIFKVKSKMEEDLENISQLKSKEEKQKALLQEEQERKRRMVNNLGSKEKQLKKDLEDKKKIAQKIESEIARVIEEERKKSKTSELTPEMRLIGESFEENKGRLPWPVEKGIVTSKFGPQKHPVLNYVNENNIGIEITSYGKTEVRAVFKGQIVKIFAIQGANASIILRHGKYFTVYQNMVNIKLKQGDMVNTKDLIGEVYCEADNGNRSILKFMIFLEKQGSEPEKIDPEQWIAKK